MSAREYVFVTNGQRDWNNAPGLKYVHVTNAYGRGSEDAQKTVVVVNRMPDKPSYTPVFIVNNGLPDQPSAEERVHVENLEDLPIPLQIAWRILRCPQCGGPLRDFATSYGCDRCRIAWSEWDLLRGRRF